MFTAKTHPSQRCASRRRVNMKAFAMQPQREGAEVVVSDLSYDGCRIQPAQRFRPGESIELRVVRLGVVQAEVRWVAGPAAGVRFSQ